MNLYKIIKHPILTEKAYSMIQNQNKYVFAVDPKSNKTELKKIFGQLFGVKVIKVNLQNQRPRSRTIGRNKGFGPSIRKAIFTLAPGDKIEILTSMSSDFQNTNLADLKEKLDNVENKAQTEVDGIDQTKKTLKDVKEDWKEKETDSQNKKTTSKKVTSGENKKTKLVVKKTAKMEKKKEK